MSLRADNQQGPMGGSTATGLMGVQGLGLGGPDDKGNIAIEKYMKWNWAFFGGAVLTFLTGLCTALHWMMHLSFAPATFFFEIFLTSFGALMLVLDTPIPHIQKHRTIQTVRYQIYKFALILTRFMGRGATYLFLATMVFTASWDSGINWFLGGLCTSYLTVLGTIAMTKGFLMTNKLNRVREAILSSGYGVDRYVSRGQAGMSKPQIKMMIESATNDPALFRDEEVDYLINALNFNPSNDGTVTTEELQYWLSAGPPLMV